MVEENKENEASAQSSELNPLAMEAARELSPEFLHRSVAIMEGLSEEEQEQATELLIKEMNIRVNEIYQRKKQGNSN